MTTPVRLRLSRARGFELQAHSLAINGLPAKHVARPGPWGNPFEIGKDGTRQTCVYLYLMLLGGMIALNARASVEAQKTARAHAEKHLHTLKGHNLACWCALDGGACHADVLLAAANAPEGKVSEALEPLLKRFSCEAAP